MPTSDIDVARLREFLVREHPGLVNGPLTSELITGGRSNLTYRVTDGTSRWVLRRPPLGHVLATAHDMAREYRVMSALAGTAVPVPGMVLLHEDPELLGAPFYLMTEVAGTVYRTAAEAAKLGEQRVRALSFELVTVLADLHAIDPEAVGLAGFGHPEGFPHRQTRRWRKQLDASRSRELPALDELHHELEQTVPETGRGTIVHGDFRLDNTIVTDDDRIAAVVDWEMATLGDPLTDLGLLATYWEGMAEIESNPAVTRITRGSGFPPFAELVDRYAERSDLDLSELPWYVAFGHFKLAVIAEGIHFRYLQGMTVGPGFEQIGDIVTPLAERALRILRGTL
ncbi:phosphotransferase family protein [Flindersiella endophytica]